MARVRRPGEAPSPPTRGPASTALAALLGARRFRLGAGAERVAENLARHGGESAPDAAPWIGATRPPPDAPSLALGEHAGTLGPASFGFLNNVGGVAAFDAPLPSLPRRGGLALVVPRREALPDLAPLALGRGLGISWIISVGDGDPAGAIEFLGADAATAALAIRLGPGAGGASLRQALGAKPAVVWGGDPVCRAVVRRAGAIGVDGIEEWLARAALFDAGVEPGAPVSVLVVGGGRAFVAAEVAAAGLTAEVAAVDERAPEDLFAALERARGDERAVIVVAGGPPPLPPRDEHGARVIGADLRHPEQLRALLAALAAPRPAVEERARPHVDKKMVTEARKFLDVDIPDHHAKQLLRAYGARVSRQGVRSTPTAAVELAKTIKLPVVLVCGDVERVAERPPDVRRLAALMLQQAGKNPSVVVRERFPEVPRARVRVQADKGLGLTLRVGEACALVPLTRADALDLAAATSARRAADQRAVADLLQRIAACAAGEDALLDLEIFVGAEPAVISASGTLRSPARA